MDIQQIDRNPFAPLDALYDHILSGSPDPTLAVKWLSVISRLDDMACPAFFLMHILQEEAGQADYLLEALTSLVRIPPSDDELSPYKLYHRSLVEFLSHPNRCGMALYLSYMDDTFLPRHCRRILGERDLSHNFSWLIPLCSHQRAGGPACRSALATVLGFVLVPYRNAAGGVELGGGERLHCVDSPGL